MIAAADSERAKYARRWGDWRHLGTSPGGKWASHAVDLLGARSGESIIDYGCGSGKAARAFASRGLKVTGVDIAENAPDADVPMRFVQAPLWDLPPDLEAADWAFCCDVLEHLPEDKLDTALDQMAQRTRRGGYLRISLESDSLGSITGDRYHLTVRPRNWWLRLVSEHFACLGEDTAQPAGHLALLARKAL